MLKNSEQGYGLVAIIIHWVSAILVFGLFVVGYWMVDLDYYSEWYHTAPHYHQSVGLLLALLTLMRLAWVILNPKPNLLSNIEWQNKIAHAVHIVLYLLLLVLFVSGYLIVTLEGATIALFDWVELPSAITLEGDAKDTVGDLHQYGAYTLMALVILHAAAALKHHFIDRDKTLTRMLTTSKR